MTLRGARILLAGACSRTGQSLTEAFLALGAQVIAADRLRTQLEELRAQLRQHERLWVAEADLGGPSAAAALFADVARDEPIDTAILIVRAAEPADGTPPQSDASIPGAAALGGIAPALRGGAASRLCQCESFLAAALEPMSRHGRGRVLVLLEPDAEDVDTAMTVAARALVQDCADRAQASGSALSVAGLTACGAQGALRERVVALCDPARTAPHGWQAEP
jgi:NAD(P)-dependent dehydrogenase (short-subunit alcohol dehydrogenase family)